ncbi:hypothetical protein Tco_0544660, partial [Tanacetum coccineum]
DECIGNDSMGNGIAGSWLNLSVQKGKEQSPPVGKLDDVDSSYPSINVNKVHEVG